MENQTHFISELDSKNIEAYDGAAPLMLWQCGSQYQLGEQ
jgi:hypothetical protein